MAGTGWSVVNPALGKGIMDVFPAHERGVAMGIKQMGLTLGGVASALVLPTVAARYGWRSAIATGALVVALPVVATWRPLAPLATAAPTPTPSGAAAARPTGRGRGVRRSSSSSPPASSSAWCRPRC